MSLRDWTKQSGAFKIGEFTKSQGELITNGDFSDGDTSWGKGTGWTIDGGKAIAINVTGGNAYLTQSGILTGGKKYRVTIVIDSITSGKLSGRFGTNDWYTLGSFDTAGTHTVDLIAGSDMTGIFFQNNHTFGALNCVIDSVSITEIPPLETITTGTKYLECTTEGNITIPTTKAFGTWEFDINKTAKSGAIYIELSGDTLNRYWDSVGTGYWFTLWMDDRVYVIKRVASSLSILFKSGATTLALNTWYSVRITRNVYGVFTLWIKGGAFGNTWTLLSATGGSGANPTAADLTLTKSIGMSIDLTSGSYITNIKFYDGVRQ